MADKRGESDVRPGPKEAARTDVARGPKAVLVTGKDFRETASIANSLEACGYDVSAWTDVADAREKLAARQFELVILSTNLGQKGMDDILGDLRAMRITPKVILIADEDEGDAASRCFLRVVAVVNRPFQLSEFADIVTQLIGPP